MKDIAAAPTMSEQDQHLGESAQDHGEDGVPHDSDDEPMVYIIPKDYATLARQERDRLIAEGADPESIILQSEVRNHIPQEYRNSRTDFAKHYAETMNL